MRMQKKPFKSLLECKDLKGKYVFLRASLNVPIVDGEVHNQFRITRGMATVQHLVNQGARVIIAGHVGSDGSASMQPVADIFAQQVPVVFSGEVLGTKTTKLRDELADG